MSRVAPAGTESQKRGGEGGFLRSVDRYWFGFGSATTLGVYRILIGFLVFVNWCMIAIDWDAWFSEHGYTPAWIGSLWMNDRTAIWAGSNITVPRLDLLNGVTTPWLTILFYVLTIVAAFLTMIGYGTRFSAFLLAICTVTLHHRNAAILHGGDTVVRLSVIYLAVSPCGRACSVDRLLGLWRGTEKPGPVEVSLWPQRVITYNVALLYLTTVWIKRFGDKWINGTATWYPAQLAEFFRFPVPSFMASPLMVKLTTYGTLGTEFALATLVFFRPLRKYVLLGGVLMHAYIEYSMNIPLFSFLMMANYVCFFEGEEVSAWFGRVGARLRRWHVQVRLPQGERLKPNVAALLDGVDPLRLVTYLPGETDGWTASRFDGSPIEPRKAIRSRSLGAWPFAWIPELGKRVLATALEPDVATPATTVPRPKRSKSGVSR